MQLQKQLDTEMNIHKTSKYVFFTLLTHDVVSTLIRRRATSYDVASTLKRRQASKGKTENLLRRQFKAITLRFFRRTENVFKNKKEWKIQAWEI